MTKLYVGNLPYSVTFDSLKEIFANYGEIVSSTIITDKMSGRSKGFGFIELADDKMAQKAIEELNDTEMEGRKIVVSVARPMKDRE